MPEHSDDLFVDLSDTAQPDAPAITRVLAEEYRASRFIVRTEERDIRILLGRNRQNTDLLRLNGAANAAFLTAYNPVGRETSDEENKGLQDALVSEVADRWRYLPGERRSRNDDWSGEPGILILGIDLDDARTLAIRHRQFAFVSVEEDGRARLIAADPEEQSHLIHPVHRRTSDRWLVFFLQRAQRSNWCNNIGCTTCGSLPFRNSLFRQVCRSADIDRDEYSETTFESLGILNEADLKKARRSVIEAIRRVPPSSLDELDREYVLMSLGLIFFELGFAPQNRTALEKFRQVLGSTWADEFFSRMQVPQATL